MSTHAPDYRADGTGDRADWLVRLLYAPNDSGNRPPMYGRTRMMKAAFLVDRKLKENFGKVTDFDFEAGKYGPFDRGVYEALEHLEQQGYLSITPSEEHGKKWDGREYVLTPEGRELGETLWDDLDPEERDLLCWIRYEQTMKSLSQLLSYVYRNYPKMTTNSEITDRVA